MEINSVNAAQNLANVKKTETESKEIIALSQDLKKAKNTKAEDLVKMKSMETPKEVPNETPAANSQKVAEGVKTAEQKEGKGNNLDLLG